MEHHHCSLCHPSSSYSLPFSLLRKCDFIQQMSSNMFRKIGPSSTPVESVDHSMLITVIPFFLPCGYFRSWAYERGDICCGHLGKIGP